MNRKQFVQIGDTKSTTNDIKTGVPQESILGPLLFIIYINDMSIASKYFAFILYADDTTLMFTIQPKDFNNPQHLASKINKEIKLINKWLKINKLSLNIIKSKFMLCHMPQREITPSKLDIAGIFIFLGIKIQNNLKWDTHINSISLKIGRTVGILNKLKHSLPLNISHLFYCTSIVPHLHYGILLWSYANVRIYKLQKRH